MVNYILREDKNIGSQHILTHNLRSKGDIDRWVKEFEENESFRQRKSTRQIAVYHSIISFSKFETDITVEKLTDIANRYIQERGTKGIFLGAIHTDKQHYHIHFAESGSEFRTGKAFRLSKDQFKELKINLQEYHKEKFPELVHSSVNHGSGKAYVCPKEYYARQKDERALNKVHVERAVTSCFAKAASQRQFLQLLLDNDLPHYERKGVPQGVWYQDMKFRFNRLGVDYATLPPIELQHEGDSKAAQNTDISTEFDLEPQKHTKLKTTRQLQDIRQELQHIYEQQHGVFIKLAQGGYSDKQLAKELDIITLRESYLLKELGENERTVDTPPAAQSVENSQTTYDTSVPSQEQQMLDDIQSLRNDAEQERDELDRDIDEDFER